MGSSNKIFTKFIGNFNTKNFAKKVDALSDGEQDKLSESLIQDSNNSGGGGIVQRHESDSVDFLEIFSKRVSSSHSDISLSKKERGFCFKVANRLNLLGMDENKAVDLAIKNKNKTHMNVDKLVKQLYTLSST